MSVFDTVRWGSGEFFTLPRVFEQLPEGIQPWRGAGTITGDASGGLVSITFQFNPDQLNVFQPYIAVQACFVNVSVADPKDGKLVTSTSDWEDVPAGISAAVMIIPTIETTDLNFSAAVRKTTYLGRARQATTAGIVYQFDNVNGAVHDVMLRGWYSEMPFQPPDNLTA